MRRYAPDSIKFGDAKPSSFGELKVGDQLRALGDRTRRSASFQPAKVRDRKFSHCWWRGYCDRSSHRRDQNQRAGEEDSAHDRYQARGSVETVSTG